MSLKSNVWRILLCLHLGFGILGSLFFRSPRDAPLLSWLAEWTGAHATFQFFSPDVPSRPRVTMMNANDAFELSAFQPNREIGLRITNVIFNAGHFRSEPGFLATMSEILRQNFSHSASVYWDDPILKTLNDDRSRVLCYRNFYIDHPKQNVNPVLSPSRTASLCSE